MPLLVAIFLAAHLPFLPASLEDIDSINFALGLRHFDVAQHQPHPPGYPIYIALGKTARLLLRSEVNALSALGVVAGALGILALAALFARMSPIPGSPRWPFAATLLTVTSPLYWFTAGRPLSDVPGLAAAFAVQALTLAAHGVAGLATASVFAGLAVGLRSQVAWLTLPLIALTIVRRPRLERLRTAAAALAGFGAGVLAWAVPLVVLSGGARAYWRVLFEQGTDDLTGVQMLWTTPTPRQLMTVLYHAFVAPWGEPWMAIALLVFATAGAARLYRDGRPLLTTLIVAFGPYLIFDLLFQEAVTTRYALPLVAPVAFLVAVAAAGLPEGAGFKLVVGMSVVNAMIGGMSYAIYADQPAPAFRLLRDMRGLALQIAGTAGTAPVLAMHRRADLELRRPIAWVGNEMPPISRRLPAPPKHEWLEMVKYWNSGGRNDVWIVADPLRSDLALIDRSPFPVGLAYFWPLRYRILLGGVRPDAMRWYRIVPPGWYLGEGWAMTPETAGVAQEDGRGPGRAPIHGWIRRRPERATLLIGGRNLAADGAAGRVTVAIDGKTIDEPTMVPGFFLRLLNLAPGTLAGTSGYAEITVSASDVRLKPDATGNPPPVNVAIEQFEAQSADRVVFGYGEGWHELEHNPSTGLLWRWTSERAALHVHAGGHAVALTLAGETGYYTSPSRVTVRVGDRIVIEQALPRRFGLQATIPADLLKDETSIITIETNQTFVPADRSRRSRDRRQLGLQVFECSIRPVS